MNKELVDDFMNIIPIINNKNWHNEENKYKVIELMIKDLYENHLMVSDDKTNESNDKMYYVHEDNTLHLLNPHQIVGIPVYDKIPEKFKHNYISVKFKNNYKYNGDFVCPSSCLEIVNNK
jgi:hypothetical protein